MTGSAIRRHPLLLLPLLALVLGFIAAAVLAAAALLTVPPHTSSAQPSGLYQLNIGQLVSPVKPGPTTSPGPGNSAPASGLPGAVGGGTGQLTSHVDGARHHGRHAWVHPATWTLPGPGLQWRLMSAAGPDSSPGAAS